MINQPLYNFSEKKTLQTHVKECGVLIWILFLSNHVNLKELLNLSQSKFICPIK